MAAEVAARRQLPERLRGAQDRQQALQQKLDELDKLDDWRLQLRIDPQQQAELVVLAGDEPAKLYRLMRAAASGTGGTARLAWKFCAAAVRSRWFWLGLLLVAAAIVLAVVAHGPLGRLLGTAVGLAALLGTAIQTVRSSLAELKNQAKPVIERVRQYADTRRRRLQTAFEIATAQVEALQVELHELTPAGQLTVLVERRGGGDSPYRAQLGLMTQIREDFEEMARLLAAPADQPSAESDVDVVGDELPRIDRIVVYIDDLDRCPPDQAVQVLEAVQSAGQREGQFRCAGSSQYSLSGRDNRAELNLATGSDGNQGMEGAIVAVSGQSSRLLICPSHSDQRRHGSEIGTTTAGDPASADRLTWADPPGASQGSVRGGGELAARKSALGLFFVPFGGGRGASYRIAGEPVPY